MSIINVKYSLLKNNLHVSRLKEMTTNNVDIFDYYWKFFIDVLRVDKHTEIVGIWYEV